MLLKRIKNNLLVFRRLVSLPGFVYNFLETGTYRYNEPCTLLFNEKYKREASSLLENVFEKKHPNNNLFRKIFALLYRKHVEAGSCLHKGSLLLLTSSGHEYKIFDFKNKKVLTIYNDAKKCHLVYNNREIWSKDFTTVDFKLHQDQNAIEEQMISRIPCDSTILFAQLLKDYNKYLSNTEHCPTESYVQDDLIYFCRAIGRESDFKLLREYILGDDNISCVTHGDLWYSNVMMTENGLFYLDFENIGPRVFYYDLFFFIVGDYLFRGNDVLLDAFRNGMYDRDFDSLFHSVGAKYYPEKKITYIETVFFLLYLEKWKNTEIESNVKLVAQVLKEFV